LAHLLAHPRALRELRDGLIEGCEGAKAQLVSRPRGAAVAVDRRARFGAGSGPSPASHRKERFAVHVQDVVGAEAAFKKPAPAKTAAK
jgi:hypothetical protein